ncbi:MAG: PTS transporter subunit EIIC [Firmicutes bacterium]|nr:PTS transporter subunit EIIC [Bacillota bacterium]
MKKKHLFSSFVDKFSAAAGAIGRQRHLGAIRDGFVTIMPLMVAGSLVTLINNFPIGSGQGEGKTRLADLLSEIGALKWLAELNGNVWWGTFGLLSIFAIAAIAYHLAKSYDSGSPISAAVVSLSAYLCIVPQMSGESWGVLHWGYLNATSLFAGIIIALVSTELFSRLSKSGKLKIKMPSGVPPAVGKSFAALLPSLLTLILVVGCASVINVYTKANLLDRMKDIIVSPLREASGSFGFGLVVVLLTHVFWIFGIHGANMFEGILQTFNVDAVANNLAAGGSGTGILIFNKSFADAFIYMGGAGVCLGLVIALILAGKSKQNRMAGRLGAAPALFNINEPILFGLPVVLNPVFAVPFILAPVVNLGVAYAATAVGFLPAVQYVIPWTMPPIVSGLLATGWAWQAPVIQIVNLALSVLIYLPFVKAADKIEEKRELAKITEGAGEG